MSKKKTKIICTVAGLVTVLIVALVVTFGITRKNDDTRVEKNGLTVADNSALKEIIADIDYMYEHNAYVKVKINANDTDEDAKLIFLNKNGTVYEEYNTAVNVYYDGTNKIRMTDYPISDKEISTIDYIRKMAEFIETGKGTVSKKEEGNVYKYTMKIKTTDDILDFYTFMIDEKYCEDVWAGRLINRDDAKVFDNQNYIKIEFNWSKDNKLTANCKSDINDDETYNWYIEEFREMEDWDSGEDWSKIDVNDVDKVEENIKKLQESVSDKFKPIAEQIQKDKEKEEEKIYGDETEELTEDDEDYDGLTDEEILNKEEQEYIDEHKAYLKDKSDDEIKKLIESAKKTIEEEGYDYLTNDEAYAYYYGEDVLEDRKNGKQ